MHHFGNDLIARSRADQMTRVARRDATIHAASRARRPGPVRRLAGRSLVRFGERLERGRPASGRAPIACPASVPGCPAPLR